MQLPVVRAGSLDLQTKHEFVQILKGLVFNVGLSLWHLQPRFDIWYVCLKNMLHGKVKWETSSKDEDSACHHRGKSPGPTNQVDVRFKWNQEKINTLLSVHLVLDVAKQQVQNSKYVSASAHCTKSHIHYHTLSHARWQATGSKQSME